MSEQSPEFDKVADRPRETGEIYHEKSITGSAQSIGIEPSEGFAPATMALDSFEPTADD